MGRSQIKGTGYLSILIAGAVLLSGCGKKEEQTAVSTDTKPAEVVVKIGHAAPLTGPQSHLGKDNENGARLAIEDWNAKKLVIAGKSVKFELLGEDDQADPKTGTTVAQKLVDAKVNGVVGHLNSGTTIPASKIYADAGIPQVSPSATNPTYTQQGFKTAFRVMANDVQQGSAIGNFAARELQAKTIALIHDKTAYGEGLVQETKKAVEAAGVKVVAEETTTDRETDFKAILTKIKGKAPDVVMFGGMDSQAGPMLKQFKELGVAAKFMTGDGSCTTKLIELAGGGAAEGHYCSQAGLPPEKMTQAGDFFKRYEQRFGTKVQIYGPYAYDAASAIIQAMQKANSVDPLQYLPALANISFDGVTGKVEFDEKGDIKNGAVTVFQVQNGQLVPKTVVGGAVVATPAAAAAGDTSK